MIDIVAEFGQTFGGDLGFAIEMVHAFAEAGATHIKVQMLDPETIATADAASYWQTGPAVLQRDSFAASGIVPHDSWGPVRRACDDAHVGFVATPFDLDAVRALADLDPAAVKIASGDLTCWPLLRAVATLGKPVFLSTGAATFSEVLHAEHELPGCKVIPLACTLAYPTAIDGAHLHRVHMLRHTFVRVGYSDHTLDTVTSGDAVLAGATLLEKHVTMRPFDPACPDNAMGLTPEAFKQYVAFARDALDLLGPHSFDPTLAEASARVGARRAARYAHDLQAGERITLDDVTLLRPDPTGNGASMRALQLALRDRALLARDVRAEAVVVMRDFQ